MIFNRIMNSTLRSQLVVLVMLAGASVGALFIPPDTSWLEEEPVVIPMLVLVPIACESPGQNAGYNPGSEFVKILDSEI